VNDAALREGVVPKSAIQRPCGDGAIQCWREWRIACRKLATSGQKYRIVTILGCMNAAPDTHPEGRPIDHIAATRHDPTDPGSYPRRVLLLVTGLSPQIVTETIYALTQRTAGRFVPTEVRVLTTREGRERARLTLLSDDPGWFHRLRRDYQLPAIQFAPADIEIVGGDLDDIRTEQDNERAADAITRVVREFTRDPDLALHVSMAGGRKTMGFYAGYALSIFGRPQDRLSHVLVSSPFEGLPGFFYPTRESMVIYTGGERARPVDAREAEVTLAEIPFVSLRHGLPSALLAGDASFMDTVQAAREALGPPRLVIDLRHSRVMAGERTLQLQRGELALLALFARRALAGEPPLAAPTAGVPDPDWARAYLAELRSGGDDMTDLDKTERTLRKGMDGDYFSQKLSRLRSSLKRELGPASARPYLIDDGGRRPRRYRLTLPPESIAFASLAAMEEPA